MREISRAEIETRVQVERKQRYYKSGKNASENRVQRKDLNTETD